MRPRLLLLLTLVGAFLLRCRFLADVFLEGRVLPFDPDSTYHLWRIDYAVNHGLRPPRFDWFVNAPLGARIIWPDGFDGLMAWFVWLSGARDRHDVEVVSLFVMPLLGVLAVWAVYALALRVSGRTEALVAAVIAAVLPAHVLGAILGHVDHHVIELLLPPLGLTVALSDSESIKGKAVLAGALLATLVFCLPTALLHVAVLGAALVAAALGATRMKSSEQAVRLLQTAAIAFATAALLVLPLALSRTGYAFYEPSRLPPILLAAGSAFARILALVAPRGLRALIAACAVLAVAAGLIATLILHDAAGFIAGAGVLRLVTEAQPITHHPFGALEMLSLALPLVPLALLWFAWSQPGAASWALATVGLAGTALYALQGRFEVFLAPSAAVALAIAGCAIWRHTHLRGHALLGVASLIAIAPCAEWLARARLAGPSELATLEAAEWLKAKTLPTGDRYDDGKPDYTILPLWGDGGHFAYLAERPVVVGAFYHGDFAAGLKDSLDVLFGDGDPEPILERRKVRYLVLPALGQSIVATHRQILGLDPAPATPTLYTQLYQNNGSSLSSSDGRILPALGHLRLVHQSPIPMTRDQHVLPAIKIFERVAGAELHGPCIQGVVMARVELPEFDGPRPKASVPASDYFVAEAPCIESGFSLRIPYPGSVQFIAPNASTSVFLDETDVRGGRSREVVWLHR